METGMDLNSLTPLTILMTGCFIIIITIIIIIIIIINTVCQGPFYGFIPS